jgi:hypothetical protein
VFFVTKQRLNEWTNIHKNTMIIIDWSDNDLNIPLGELLDPTKNHTKIIHNDSIQESFYNTLGGNWGDDIREIIESAVQSAKKRSSDEETQTEPAKKVKVTSEETQIEAKDEM